MAPPPLSVVIASRNGLDPMQPTLDALLPQARATGAEVIVVGPVSGAHPADLRVVPVDDGNMFRLRMIGIQESRGDIVAIGEDHAVPRPDWCEAVLRAHTEHPDASTIVGCLVNGTDGTLSGRSNFLAFAAPFQPPMPVLSSQRPPPLSALSLKRAALTELDDIMGGFEAVLVPRLFAEGRMIVDDRIVMDHWQDHGVRWSIANGFHAARSAYGYLRATYDRRERLSQAWWGIAHWPRRLLREARDATRSDSEGRMELAVVALIATGIALGCAVGSLAGPGKSPTQVE